MTKNRVKRLLSLATEARDHKRHYSQYCKLMSEGLVGWALGHAYLTQAGEAKLEELLNDDSL